MQWHKDRNKVSDEATLKTFTGYRHQRPMNWETTIQPDGSVSFYVLRIIPQEESHEKTVYIDMRYLDARL